MFYCFYEHTQTPNKVNLQEQNMFPAQGWGHFLCCVCSITSG